jgi:alcohol dehydrogenase (cytochrome c)
MEWQSGKGFMGGAARPAPGETFEKYLRAIDIKTGEIKFDVPQVSGTLTASAGTLSTVAGIVFFGENSGDFMAADATTGKVLWQFQTNQTWKASPMTYMFANKQYVAVAAGPNIIAFALPN